MIINEMNQINTDKSHEHYIVPKSDYIFLINLKFGCLDEDMVLVMSIDPELYPYYPPKIDYVSPNVKSSLMYNITNLDVLNVMNWNPTININ